MGLNYIIVKNKSDLLKHQTEIFRLFEKCFNSELNEELWRWEYLENPLGEPIVSLCYSENKLIGHYAVVPYGFHFFGESIIGGLSMTTMVDVSFRRYGVFNKQALDVYEEAKKLNYKFIFGFPNKNSAPGFEKRLGWKIMKESKVIKILGMEINRYKSIFDNINEKKIEINQSDAKFFNWRLNKPNEKYTIREKFIEKSYKGDKDLVFLQKDFEKGLNSKEYYKIFVPNIEDEMINLEKFDYYFGFLNLSTSIDINDFKIDLIMSDVF